MRRLPVNLASQPLEHRQWLRRVTLTTAAVVVVVSALHGLLAWSLIDEPQVDVPDAEVVALLRDWSDEVETLVTEADPRGARRVAIAVAFANALIDQRAFPWSRLFSTLEESMPDDVRLEIVQPVATVDGVRVSLTAASASGQSLLDFLAALERRPEFLAVFPGRQLVGTDGELRLSVEALARIDRVPATPPGGQRP